MISAHWQDYVRWNDVVADVLFPERDDPAPVYLDVEVHAIAAIGERLNVGVEEVVETLVAVVARTIDHDSYADGFAQHLHRVRTWRQGERSNTYPAVATLAVFSLAAERMAAGGGMASTNYYGRLADLLDGDKDRLSRSYQRVAEPLWAGLNLWLSTLAGRRGTPTAFALGKRFIGLPLSQALVREADRRKLERFFSEFEFAPRSDVPAAELEMLLDAWLADEQRRAPSHLSKLWSQPALRERIAGVASVELQSWNGVDDSNEPGSATSGRALLGLHFRGFPQRKVVLFPYFFMSEPGTARNATLATTGGDHPVVLVPSLDLHGSMSLADPEVISAAHFLEGLLQVTDDVNGTVAHPPRAMLVFRKDELSGIWLETRQVLMGDDVVVLATKRTLDKVRSLLGEIARPGWTEDSGRSGLPTGWTLFEKVEIFGRSMEPTGQLNQEFHALVPLTSSQLKLSGGFALPGASRSRWHSSCPPEIRSVHDGGPFEVRLLDLDVAATEGDDPVLDSWSDDSTGSVLIDLATQELQDGHYALEMHTPEKVVARREFTLHSSEQRDEAQWSRHETITHSLDSPLAALGAGISTDGRCIVQGVVVAADEPPQIELSVPPDRPWWIPAGDQVRTPSVALRRPDPESCFFTGAHRLELPVAMTDNARETVTATCSHCGTRKRYSANYYRNRSAFQRRQDAEVPPQQTINVAALPPVVADSTTTTAEWDVALDALRFLGGGPTSNLERIARQLDPSTLFVSDFIATLEALGHIEVRRSPETLQPEAWEIAPTAIIDIGPVRVLTGFWTDSLIADATISCRENGRKLDSHSYENGLSRYSTDATSRELAEWLDVDGVLLPERTGLTIATFLPRLSDLIANLRRTPAPTMTDLQWFDPARAAWIDAVGAASPGAYRVGRYAAKYFIRTDADVERGTRARASAYLAKHFAAVTLSGRSLLAYASHAKTLVVPLGARLPGMYERAVVLDSGASPQKNRGMHVYRDVSEDVAARITYLLEN